MQDKVVTLFKNGKTPYQIHMNLGIGISEVYHYCRQSEELRKRQLDALRLKG